MADSGWQDRFLASLERYGNIGKACKAAGIARGTQANARKNDAEFVVRFNDAMASAIDRLEEEARRRAVDGVKKPVYQGGVLVGYERQYSDALLRTLLQANRPEKFRETYRAELTGANGGPIDINGASEISDRILGRLDSIAARIAAQETTEADSSDATGTNGA